MFVTEKQLKRAEEDINKRVEDLKQKVSANNGKIILTSREIILGEHNHCLGSFSDNMNYIETGIINGELKILKQDFSGMKSLKPIGGFFDSNHLGGDYHYFPEVQIPVKNKLSRKGVYFNLDFSIEDLEKSEKAGFVEIDRTEFDPGLRRGLSSIPGIDLPYLNSLEILIGDEEIQNFAKGKSLQKQVDYFFNLMKNSGEIEDKINKHQYNERKKLSEDLVQNVAQLSGFNNRIKELENRLLQARFIRSGRGYGEWDSFSSKNIDEYKRIMGESDTLSGKIKEGLSQADKTQLIKLPEIDLRVLGIPQIVKTGDFLDYVNKEVLSDYTERIKRIDTHLRKERKG